MLVFGCVNPPPVCTKGGYRGVYLSDRDDMGKLAASLRDKPLLTEHKENARVGNIISAWTGPEKQLFMLAEIDTKQPAGAVAAACVSKGYFQEFSLGYKAKLCNSADGGVMQTGEKEMVEASIVVKGAREGCRLQRFEAQAIG
jgi:hypothetical protein